MTSTKQKSIVYRIFDYEGKMIEGHESTISVEHYRNGNLAVCVHPIAKEFKDEDFVITVNLGVAPTDCACAFIDDNNNPYALKWIEENQLGELTGRVEASGFWIYHEVRFDLDKLASFARQE